MKKPRKRDASLYTVRQIAETCQISEKTVRRRIEDGEITAIRLGRQLRVTPEDLEQFLRDHRL